jgi:hypothetical protein
MTVTSSPPETFVPLAPAGPVMQPAVERPPVARRWWMHLAWVVGVAIVGFAVPAVFVGALHVSRAVFVLPYVAATAALLYLYVRWDGVDVSARVRHNWIWGVIGAIVAGAFVVSNVFNQPASAAPGNIELVGAILWLGVVYGATDALLLSVLPLFVAWQALAGLGWTHRWYGRVVSGTLALCASLIVAASYHLGFPEYRNASLIAPIVGNGVMSVASLLTVSPVAAIGAHIAMHIAAVLHGAETALQLPPHY